MFEKIERKLLNLILFADLLGLEKKQDPDPVRQKRTQDKRVRKLMKKAYEVPFYRERFDRIGMKPSDFRCAEDLAKFPLLTKAELREWMDSECEKEKYRYYYLDTTSGSSGTPTRVLYSPREKACNMANWMRVLIKAGYDPFRGKTVSRLSAHSASASQKNLLQRMGILRREFVNQYEPEADVIRQINEKKPDLLYMNKTELMRVALYSAKNGVQVHQPQYFVPTGEMIDTNAVKLFRSVFGNGMIDSFGTAETGACMAKFPGSDRYRIHGDLFAVNLYDDAGNTADRGKLTVTPLYKTDVPLINYVVGDQAAACTENGIRYITEVQGRMNDFIYHEDGVVTTFFMIAPVFAHCEEVLQLRVLQKSLHNLVIQAVLDKESTKSTEQIEKELTEQLNLKLKKPMEIGFEWLDAIQPDKNGKLRLIVNEMEKN